MLLPLESCAFNARNNQVSDQRKSCGRPNILYWTFAFRISVASVSCAGKKGIVILLMTLGLMSGCSLFRNDTIKLCINRPEIAAYIEYFNSQFENIRVELCYKSSMVQSLLEGKETPDLYFGEWLTGSAVLDYFESLEDLFRKGRINRDGFYKTILTPGIYEKRQVVLPFSFTIPAVIFSSAEIQANMPNLIIPIEYLKEQGSPFNQKVRSQFKRMGFSPLWNRDFLYISSVLVGAGFREDIDRKIHWNDEALQNAVEFLREWVNEINGGYDMEKAFEDKYMYEPVSKLLKENRILFYLTDSRHLFQILEEQKRDRDFRWLSYDHKIYVNEEVLYIGIPKQAKNKRGARIFLEWLYQGETQSNLLRVNQAKRLRVFGLAGGFSALRDINEREFPKYYPLLIGKIPAADYLLFPGPMPTDWEEIKNDVVIPWIFESAISESQPEDLEQKIKVYKSGNNIY